MSLRKNNIGRGLLIAAVSALGAALVFSCSSSSHPAATSGDGSVPTSSSAGALPPVDGSSGSSGASSGTSGGDGSTDSGFDAAPRVCNTNVAGGAGIAQTVLAGAPAAPAGGTIAPGTYVLTERDLYTGGSGEADASAADGLTVRRTLVFTTTNVDMTDSTTTSGGPPVLTSSSATWAPYTTILSTTETCPYAKQVANVPFTVKGAELWLLSPSASTLTRELYTKQ